MILFAQDIGLAPNKQLFIARQNFIVKQSDIK